MEEEKIYRDSMQIVRQLCDIMQKHDLQDITELKEWLKKNEVAAEIIQDLMNEKVLLRRMEVYRREDKEKETKRLIARIHRYRRRRSMIRLTAVAATILMALGIGIWNRGSFHTNEKLAEVKSVATPNVPVLILADGKQFVLGEKKENSVMTFPGNGIDYQNAQELKYDRLIGHNPDTVNIRYNRLVIPRQCNYRVVLSDGSVVHLNAESRLEYPTQFAEKERRVVLKGEAYFEIQKENRPFIVEANRIDIQVYGTKFNVDAYAEDRLETVLIEGKVGLSFQGNPAKKQILKPSQLCTVNFRSSAFGVSEVDVGKYIAWMSGFLCYDNDTLERLLQDLERWYDVDFGYATPDLKEIKISASINKDLSLKEVLDLIQTTLHIKINQAGRRYTIYR